MVGFFVQDPRWDRYYRIIANVVGIQRRLNRSSVSEDQRKAFEARLKLQQAAAARVAKQLQPVSIR